MSDKTPKQVLKSETIKEVFLSYSPQVQKLEKELSEIKVDSEIALNSAMTLFTRSKDLVDRIKEIKTEFKEPYSQAATSIESYHTMFITPLMKAIEVAGQRILTYKTSLAEKAKVEEAQKKQQLDSEFNIEYEKFQLLERVAITSYTKIFGGIAKVKGVDTVFDPVDSIEGCDSLILSFEEKFPSPNNFGRFGPNSIMIKEICLLKLNEVKNLILSGKEYDVAFHRTLLIKKIEEELESEKKRLEKQRKTEEKKIEKETSAVLSNTRNTVKYEVIDISLVPHNYLEVSKKMVDNYLGAHRADIRKVLDENGSYEPIKGIRFYYDTKITR